MVKKVYYEIDTKLDLLLKAHDIDFDDSNMNLESIEVLHAKADALLEAHNIVIPEGNHSVAALHPKLNTLIKAHGKDFGDYELDPDILDSARNKLDILLDTHRV